MRYWNGGRDKQLGIKQTDAYYPQRFLKHEKKKNGTHLYLVEWVGYKEHTWMEEGRASMYHDKQLEEYWERQELK